VKESVRAIPSICTLEHLFRVKLILEMGVLLSIHSDHGTWYWMAPSHLTDMAGAAGSYSIIQLTSNKLWIDGTARRNSGRQKFICEYSMYICVCVKE
jgi:hypothetical protein